VKALGPKRVLGVMMPEKDSSSESIVLAGHLAKKFGFETIVEDLTPALEGLDCYRKRNEAIQQVFPEFNPSDKCKITISTNILEKETYNFFNLTIEDKKGELKSKRMPLHAYLQVVAASNMKQRIRMLTLYYHAEKRNWAVVGTANKDEHAQGFFVKYGDGGADLKPIAHLYKIQIYQLGDYLGIPPQIISRTPTTDTYSAQVTQEEFFFGLDFFNMDMLWFALENNVPAIEAARVLGLTVDQVERGYANIKRKIKATEYLRMIPLEVKESE
ncbi:MAG TPA: NAD(+) synthase, partial [Desulfatiglandales bacterium]|nr:NAD(+) synthase [Desulfatiglandales bacterium]